MILFILMFLAHCIDDFCLQTHWLSNGKQRTWWVQQCKSFDDSNKLYTKYKYDYIVALLIHAFEWSAIILLPVLFYTTNEWLLTGLFIFNGIIHAYIDNLKANKMKINLLIDQSLHLVQIIITCIIVNVLR